LLTFAPVSRASYTILAIGSHPDDIEIGCGGTILRLTETYPNCHVHWVVLSGAGERTEEANQAAAAFLERAATREVVVHGFRDGFFPYEGGAVKEVFEGLKTTVQPDLVFTHHRHDLHQDHRLVCELTWNTFRDHVVLEYEVPKYDGDLGSPNLFVHLDAEVSNRKVELILEHFASQHAKPWFSEETFRSLLHLRGMESRAPGTYAEAFYCRKLAW